MPDREVLGQSVTLVGPGRAGKAFARSWICAGGRLREVISRSVSSARQAAVQIGSGHPKSLAGALSDCDILILAVPDDAVAEVARAVAQRVRCRDCFHLSGALPSEILDPLRRRGARVGSLHPLRAFTGDSSETWRGAFVAIEGDPGATRTGGQLVRAIGARGHRLSKRGKPLYHAAATLTAGGTVALLSLAVRAWVSVGLPEKEAREALAQLAAQAVGAAAQLGFEKAFTGAIARRDFGTVRAHQDALQGSPEALRVYRELALETLRRTPRRGKEKQIRALLTQRKAQGGKRKPKRKESDQEVSSLPRV